VANNPPKMAAKTVFNALLLERLPSATPLASSSKECSSVVVISSSGLSSSYFFSGIVLSLPYSR
jgi:hypothetical protein